METINFQNIEIARELFGHHNQNLVRISNALNIKINTRGNDVSCTGSPEDTKVAVSLLTQLYEMLGRHVRFQKADIDAAIKTLKKNPEFKLNTIFEKPVFVTEKKRPITPRNPAQQLYVNAIADNDLLFAIGPAGTGKTYLAMAMAVAAFSRGDVSRIILTRPAVEAGEALGFLPGDLAEKINPYLRPLYDALYDMIVFEKARMFIENETIEIAPLAFMRGRTLNNAFIILDEAQNTTSEQMKMFLTRVGYGSKAIITGDITQIDLPQGKKSGLVEAKNILKNINGISFSRFTKDDVVRHPLVSKIIAAYEKTKTETSLNRTKEYFENTPLLPWAALIIITVIFTVIHFPKQTTLTFSYKIGDVAQRDIKASKDFFFEDQEATELKKSQVKSSVRIVYDYDAQLLTEIFENIDQAFEIPGQLFHPDLPAEEQASVGPSPTTAIVMATREQFEEKLGIPVAEDAYAVLYKYQFSSEIPKKIKAILTEILSNGVVANKDLLLKEEDKGIILRTIQTSDEKAVNSLKVFYGPDQAKAMVRIVGQPLLKEMNYNLRNLIVDICQRLLQPNITMNKSETEKRILEVNTQIKPVLYKIKTGEMILREGERVDQIKRMKLDALENQVENKNVFITVVGKTLITFICLLAIYILFLKNHPAIKNDHNRHIAFLTLGLVLYLIMARLITPITQSASGVLPLDIHDSSIYMFMPISAGAMTVCLFLGFDIALYFSIIISLLTAINFTNNFEVFIFYFLSSIAAAYWINQNKERKDFIIASFKLATFNVLIGLALNLYLLNQMELSAIGIQSLLAFTGGILAGVLTTGFTPMIEFIFDYTTQSKLLEFSNLDKPVIKKLMIEAPGTYNHSVIVATLAEAAASAIGANSLIAKVCGYYHDIGKMDKTLYFIENQADGKNRHDKLSPSMSALILIQHVKKGVELAKKYKLGKEIIDGIQQHHGTSLIKYFYNKSIASGNTNVNEEDFRYPGPKPQTREAGIVMLADVVEAAVRALERPTPARIQGRVKELINSIFADGQLEECELTLKDLHEIAKSFNNILTSIYHSRIEYTDKPTEKKKRKKMETSRILIDNPQSQLLQTQALHKKIKQILSALGYEACELSVVITDNDEIARLNEQYRQVQGPTNVLSFPMQEGDFTDITPDLLGDIVISAEYARNEAQKARITLDERISQLLVHGILHLVGFDHETGEDDARKMEEKSLELIRLIEANTTLNAF